MYPTSSSVAKEAVLSKPACMLGSSCIASPHAWRFFGLQAGGHWCRRGLGHEHCYWLLAAVRAAQRRCACTALNCTAPRRTVLSCAMFGIHRCMIAGCLWCGSLQAGHSSKHGTHTMEGCGVPCGCPGQRCFSTAAITSLHFAAWSSSHLAFCPAVGCAGVARAPLWTSPSSWRWPTSPSTWGRALPR